MSVCVSISVCLSVCMFQSHLMRPTDEVKVVAVEKFANNVHPKREGDTTVVLAPTMNIFVRI